VSLSAIAAVLVVGVIYMAVGVLHLDPRRSYISADMHLENSGGLGPNAPVLLDGIQVGRAAEVRKQASGVLVRLRIDDRYRIPVASSVRIEQLSALGEPYIEFAPPSGAGPYIESGQDIPTARITMPMTITELSTRFVQLLGQLHPDTIADVVGTFDHALAGTDAAMQTLQRSTTLLAATLLSRTQTMRQLFDDIQAMGGNINWLGPSLTAGGPQFGQFGQALSDIVQSASVSVEARPVPDYFTGNGLVPFLKEFTILENKIGPGAAPLAPVLQPVVTDALKHTPRGLFSRWGDDFVRRVRSLRLRTRGIGDAAAVAIVRLSIPLSADTRMSGVSCRWRWPSPQQNRSATNTLAGRGPPEMYHTTGFDRDEIVELTELIEGFAQRAGEVIRFPPSLGLFTCVCIALVYLRRNYRQVELAEWFDTSQSTVSRAIGAVTGWLERALREHVPVADELSADEQLVVDGTLVPCWSWADRRDLYSGKHKTTGMNVQVACDLTGRLSWVSDPVPGSRHDAAAIDISGLLTSGTAADRIGDKGYIGKGMLTPIRKPAHRDLLEWEKDFNTAVNRVRYVIERAIANLKTWRILHTDYRRPIETFEQTIAIVVALEFFRKSAE
jgi:virulence factor Mce-like protein